MPGHDPASMNPEPWIAGAETPDLIRGRNGSDLRDKRSATTALLFHENKKI